MVGIACFRWLGDRKMKSDWRFNGVGADDAFPRKAGEFEIEKQGEVEAGYCEIACHLGEMGISESGDDFGVYDDGLVDDEVGDERADQLGLVVNLKDFLLVDAMAAFGQLDGQGVLMELFVEAGLQGVEHFHRRADDVFAEFFVDGAAMSDF